MSRCGCADTCTCEIQGQYGIAIDGTGAANNPYRIRFDPRVDSIIGPGLFWSESTRKLAAFISGDDGNSLTIGTDNGLYAPPGGSGGSSPTTGGATVANLPAANIVGGFLGAGYLYTPENFIRSYQRAVQIGLDMVLVPVRTLRDGATVAVTDTDVARITDSLYTYNITDVDTQRWSQMPQVASRYMPATALLPENGLSSRLDPVSGFFGYNEAPQQGGTFCADIAERIGGRIVIAWQIYDTRAIPDLQRILRKFRLISSSIVTASDLTLLDPFKAMGVATAAAVTNSSHLTSLSPDKVKTAGATWAFVNLIAGFTSDAIRAYPQSGLQTVGFPPRYQSENTQLNKPIANGGLGLRGGLSPDPMYYNGANNGYTYRHAASTWDRYTIEYGHFNNEYAWGPEQRPSRRGYTVWGHNSLFLSGADGDWRHLYADAGHATTGPWWIQLGWMCPVLPDANGSYTLAWWTRWRWLNQGSTQNFLCLALGVDADHALKTGPKAGWKTAADVGYVAKFEYGNGANSYFEDHKTDLTVASNTFHTSGRSIVSESLGTNLLVNGELGQNKIESCYGVQVDAVAGTITLLEGQVNRDTGRLTGQTQQYKHPEYTHRGKYVYVGKCGESSWDGGDSSKHILGMTWRRFTSAPGIQSLQQMFPWAV